MITKDYLEDFNSPIRKITGKAELYTSSAETKSGNYVVLENPDPTEKVRIKVSSKNLINPANIKYGYELTSYAGAFTQNSTWYITDWIKVEPSTTYTISGISSLFRAEVDEELKPVSSGNFDRVNTFTTTDKTHYIQFNSLINGYDKPQLEKGSTASEYTPYMSIEGGKGDLYFEDITLTGGELWDSGYFTVSEWWYDDSGEIFINFDDGNYIGISANFDVLGYTSADELIADYELPTGTELYYDAETNSLYRVEKGLVGNTITVGGKNLIDYRKAYARASHHTLTIDESIDGLYWTGSYYFVIPVSIPAGTTLKFNCEMESVDSSYDSHYNRWDIVYVDGTTQYVGDKENGLGYFTLKKDLAAIRPHKSNVDDGNQVIVRNIQLEKGTTATEYEPYKEPTVYTIDETLTIEAEPYIPTTIIDSDNKGIIVDAEYTVCKCNNTFTHDGALQSITIDKIGEKSKFFGFIVSQKATINLLDRNRELNFSDKDYFKLYFNINENDFVDNFPRFFVLEEPKRNETTNALTITALDYFGAVAGIPVSELGLNSYTIREFAEACAKLYGLKLEIRGVEDETVFDTSYESGANFEGTETVRDALRAIAEATQTICYVSPDSLVFRRLGAAAADINIEKKHYFSLTNKGVKTLANICHATELGDNVISSSTLGGETQYVRDNPFWDMREDIADIVENAIAAIGGLTINQYECNWRGNFLAEIGDRVDITTKDDEVITSYLLDDKINYKGGYSQSSNWTYEEGQTQSPSNPSTLGEVLKQTFAKVDKVNKQIDIVASEASANTGAIAALQLTTGGITASVSKLEGTVKDNQKATNDELATLRDKVDLQITPEQVNIAIQEEMNKGVDKVITSTGYSFDSEGMKVSKSDSDVSTTISHEGMEVAAAGKEVLVANHEGVDAVNLKAKNYIIIDGKSRFQSWNGRTACFWIGGN